ncbi:hypothetical protein GPECTOR_15g341 [Gonium pectorale]|uniref:Uncharacterized protein n=1 Tax=Gonium pectorale TaxID=33097 RepID=A0A150GLJ3_GONPE|nr:hypothetical protein GPECTOR_15g341 [Gonium pectorale]|eukprot:KXZ50657.1 hypothetical protein GPECTOR_15g341 [Gonium pectorale]
MLEDNPDEFWTGQAPLAPHRPPRAPPPPLAPVSSPPPPGKAPYTVLNWRDLLSGRDDASPAVQLLPGQQLTLSALSLLLPGDSEPLGSTSSTLATLAPSRLFGVPTGATLALHDVTLVLTPSTLEAYLRGLCSTDSTSAYPYSPGVEIRDGSVYLNHHVSHAPWPSGILGAGGEVVWRNVTLTCPGRGVRTFVCAAVPAARAEDLRWMANLMFRDAGPVYFSITNDIAIRPEDWRGTVPVHSKAFPVLLGDPLRPTRLDLGGLPGLWTKLEPDGAYTGNFGMSTAVPRSRVAELNDLTLINLPYSYHGSASGTTLMAVGMASFNIYRHQLETNATQMQIIVRRCTLIVSDAELAFLTEAARRPGAELSVSPVLGDWKLEVAAAQVQILNSTVVSASAYADSDPIGAAGLLPQSRVWPPQALHGSQGDALRLGPLGIAVTSALSDFLSQPLCGDPPQDASVVLIPRRSEEAPSSTATYDRRAGSNPNGTCTVTGLPGVLGQSRTFFSLRGAVQSLNLAASLTLRNLVLYNLAPGVWDTSTGTLEDSA